MIFCLHNDALTIVIVNISCERYERK